jgi:hypothetical protein
MKRLGWLVVAAIVATGWAGTAVAGPGGRGPFGLGIIVGEPTGIDAKLFVAPERAFEAAAAWSLDGSSRFHLQLDYLFHQYDRIKVAEGRAPIFFGLGGRIEFRENEDDRLGLRIPVGIGYEFASAPFDTFLELAPVMDVTPDTEFTLEGAIGGRFWF